MYSRKQVFIIIDFVGIIEIYITFGDLLLLVLVISLLPLINYVYSNVGKVCIVWFSQYQKNVFHVHCSNNL